MGYLSQRMCNYDNSFVEGLSYLTIYPYVSPAISSFAHVVRAEANVRSAAYLCEGTEFFISLDFFRK